MILVDTSVWLDHLNETDWQLHELLLEEKVLAHPYVIGEVAMGKWRLRSKTLLQMDEMPRAIVAGHDEVLRFVEEQSLYGSGIGYIDAHLLASVRVTPGCEFWTRDRRLRAFAIKLGVASSFT